MSNAVITAAVAAMIPTISTPLIVLAIVTDLNSVIAFQLAL